MRFSFTAILAGWVALGAPAARFQLLAADAPPPPAAATAAPASSSTEALAEKFKPAQAIAPQGFMLKQGDRLAICGDSITEQKMYSRIMETYLTVALPELRIAVRQYGWGGETAPGFLGRMTNDCLRFAPTVATTCYGMNDHRYRAYEEAIGAKYREASTAIVKAFKAAGAKVVLGSPGCVGRNPAWSEGKTNTVDDLNLNLCTLRNIGIEIAKAEQVGFADVFWPMLTAGAAAQKKHGPEFAIAGKDGVHPGWAGQLVMAYAFLKALGVPGEIGTFTVDMQSRKVVVSAGHEAVSFNNGELVVKSSRFPFCAPAGNSAKDDNLHAGMALVPFNQELNRFVLVIKSGSSTKFRVTWGAENHTYTAEQLAKGINLAEEFPVNPLSEAFNRVDAAVQAKQNYETRQIKDLFHGPEGRVDIAATAELTEKARAPLANAIWELMTPVAHTIKIEPL